MELEKLLKLIEIAIMMDCKNISFENDSINIKILHEEIKCAMEMNKVLMIEEWKKQNEQRKAKNKNM